MDKQTTDQSISKNDPEKSIDPRTLLSVEGTELALERTQLAWIRTTLTFIGSGIGLDKGMEAIHKSRLQSGNALVDNAHGIGISLSLVGTLLMLIITVYYIRRSRSLARMKGARPVLLPAGAIASFLIILLGALISFLLIVS